MNDPIPFFHAGQYHIYFQHNPNKPVWGDMHWGHAVSDDLLHWRRLPNALAPDRAPDAVDRDGVWTGAVVEWAGTFYAYYTAIPKLHDPFTQVQALATSTDLTHWTKSPHNPLMRECPIKGYGSTFRDPCVWREGNIWLMLIGGEQGKSRGGVAYLYESHDMIHWRFLHPLCHGDVAETEFDFECPDFFPLGDRHVLITSRNRTFWQTGTYNAGRTFTKTQVGVCDGTLFYAAKTLIDDQGRRLLFGWIRENRPEPDQIAAGWSGVLSLPRELSILPDGALAQRPAAELKQLRRQERRIDAMSLDADQTQILKIELDCGEIEFTIDVSSVKRLVISVLGSASTASCAPITYDAEERRLDDIPLHLAPAEPLQLRIFIDHSVVEAFANGRICRTYRHYRQTTDRHITLTAHGASAKLLEGIAWTFTPHDHPRS